MVLAGIVTYLLVCPSMVMYCVDIEYMFVGDADRVESSLCISRVRGLLPVVGVAVGLGNAKELATRAARKTSVFILSSM